jgi:hypothetical protein
LLRMPVLGQDIKVYLIPSISPQVRGKVRGRTPGRGVRGLEWGFSGGVRIA